MRLFDKIAIVGIGLIGGSLGLVIKKNRLAAKVIGVSRSQGTLRLAKEKGAVDTVSRDMSAIKDADLVILAAPVDVILERAREVSKFIKEGCVVTDVGSTKARIVGDLDKIFDNYVGSHPLAGSEKSGVKFASERIFSGSVCVLTPTKKTRPAVLKKIKLFWRQAGLKPVVLSAQAHDKALSFVSHLPHAAAFSLISSVPREFMGFASGGLRDTTRISASDSRLWEAIFLSNRRNMLDSIGVFEGRLSALKSAIRRNDKRALKKFLSSAQLKRETLE